MTIRSSKDSRFSAVGHVIREHRKARGLTQKQLAGSLGVEARTLRMYENGERVLENISDLRRIADLLEIDPVELGLAASKHTISTTAQVEEVIEGVAMLIPQARFVEARATADTFFRNLKKRQSGNEDPVFLCALAQAHCLAGQVQAITRRTREVEHMLYHFQEMLQLAQFVDDQTLLNLALSLQGDMLRRRGERVQAILYLEQARECTPLADAMVRGNHALLLGRAYASNEDYDGFEREMAHAEQLAHTVSPMIAPLTLYSLGSVYEEYASSYARMGKLEKSRHYLQLAEKHLPTNNLWDMLLKATRAEVRVYSGEITQAMPLLIEVAHLAQMYGHQRLVERLYRLQYYLDDQSSLMRQAGRSLGEILHGPVER
jgi:transcriptional regulator with XRE-family HTH domain